MTGLVAVTDDNGAISLYFGLKDGRKADLEVVSEAALRWVDALRIAARQIDPEANIRVEVLNATESSLRLNTILEWAEQLARIDRGSAKYRRLRNLALALAVFVPFTGIPTLDYYFGDQTIELSEEDRALLQALIEETQKAPGMKEGKRQFFKAVGRDPAISKVGVSEGPSAPPIAVVPDNQFAERSGLWEAQRDGSTRTLYPIVDVVLIRPTLTGTPRAWVFQPEGLPEFSATMKDAKFLEALQSTGIGENLRSGIRMTIRLEVKEELHNGQWIMKKGGRSVIEVLSPTTWPPR